MYCRILPNRTRLRPKSGSRGGGHGKVIAGRRSSESDDGGLRRQLRTDFPPISIFPSSQGSALVELLCPTFERYMAQQRSNWTICSKELPIPYHFHPCRKRPIVPTAHANYLFWHAVKATSDNRISFEHLEALKAEKMIELGEGGWAVEWKGEPDIRLSFWGCRPLQNTACRCLRRKYFKCFFLDRSPHS